MPARAFFEPDGDLFQPTDFTRGPWSVEHQHGGPPSALLARALERAAAAHGDLSPARLWIELLKPVPVRPLRVTTELVRSGRSVTTLVASLFDASTEPGALVCRAQALFMRRAALALEPPRTAPIAPEGAPPFEFPFFADRDGYHRAMELRIVRGAWGMPSVMAWMRMRIPLVAGEEPSPLQRVLCAADSGNGVAPPLDVARYTFINPDLTVHLHRLPEGEWIGLDSSSIAEAHGVGLARSVLCDRAGPIGVALQSLLIAARDG